MESSSHAGTVVNLAITGLPPEPARLGLGLALHRPKQRKHCVTLSDCVVHCRGHEVIPVLLPPAKRDPPKPPNARPVRMSLRFGHRPGLRATSRIGARRRPSHTRSSVACRVMMCTSRQISLRDHCRPLTAQGRRLLRGTVTDSWDSLRRSMACRLCAANSATSLRSRRMNGRRSRCTDPPSTSTNFQVRK